MCVCVCVFYNNINSFGPLSVHFLLARHCYATTYHSPDNCTSVNGPADLRSWQVVCSGELFMLQRSSHQFTRVQHTCTHTHTRECLKCLFRLTGGVPAIVVQSEALWARIPEIQVRIPSRAMGTFFPHTVSSIFRLSLTHTHTQTHTHTHTHTQVDACIPVYSFLPVDPQHQMFLVLTCYLMMVKV